MVVGTRIEGWSNWLKPADEGHDGCWRVALGNPAPVEITEGLGAHRLVVRSGYCSGFHRTWTNYPHHHAYYEICLVLAGSGEYLHGRDRYRLRAGDVFLADPSVQHEINSKETRDLSLVFFTFQLTPSGSGGGKDPENDLLGAFLAGHRQHAPAQMHLFHYLPLLDTVGGGGRNRLFSARRAMMNLVLDMLGSLASDWVEGPPSARPATTMDLALDFMQRNIATGVDVKQMAEYACTSERTLRRLFKQHLGRSIQEETLSRQVHFVSSQLAAGIAAAEIARRMGLGGSSSLTRLFKRGTGLTPALYRKLHSNPPSPAGLAGNDDSLAETGSITGGGRP